MRRNIFYIAAKGLFFCGKSGKGDISMEGIFEALLYFVFELVSEIVGEIVGAILEGVFESILSGDFLTYFYRKLPESASISNEIISLGILNHNKENL